MATHISAHIEIPQTVGAAKQSVVEESRNKNSEISFECEEQVSTYTKEQLETALYTKCKQFGLDPELYKELTDKFILKNINDCDSEHISEPKYNEVYNLFANSLEICKKFSNGNIKYDYLKLYLDAELTPNDIKDTKNYKTLSSVINNAAGKKNLPKKEYSAIIDKYISSLPTSENKKKQLAMWVMQSSDDEKMYFVNSVVKQDDTTLLENFISSFGTKEEAIACLESVDTKTLLKNANSRRIVLDSVSELRKIEHLKALQPEFNKFYNENETAILKIIMARKEGVTKFDDEKLQSIAEKYDYYMGLYRDITCSAKSVDVIREVNNSVSLSDAVHEDYVYRVAEYIKDPNNTTFLPLDEFKQILDELTDGKFTQILEKIPEKSAYDQEKGEMKTMSEEAVAVHQKRAEELKAQLTSFEDNTLLLPLPQSEFDGDSRLSNHGTDNNIADTDAAHDSSFDLFGFSFDKMTSKDVKEFFSKCMYKKANHYEVSTAMNKYKNLNAADEQNILDKTSGKMFEKLVKITRGSRLQAMADNGWKGDSVAQTNFVKEAAEDKKKKSA